MHLCLQCFPLIPQSSISHTIANQFPEALELCSFWVLHVTLKSEDVALQQHCKKLGHWSKKKTRMDIAWQILKIFLNHSSYPIPLKPVERFSHFLMRLKADLYLRFKCLHVFEVLFGEKPNFCFQRSCFAIKTCFQDSFSLRHGVCKGSAGKEL